jgi:hypothetical protein
LEEQRECERREAERERKKEEEKERKEGREGGREREVRKRRTIGGGVHSTYLSACAYR